MVKLIIFSKDRAAQLHLLLESINKNLPNLFNISVLYKCTNEQFKLGYDKVIENFSDYNTSFIIEEDLKVDVDKILENSHDTCIMFAVDDDVVYRNPCLAIDNIEYFLPKSESECFSFRLGLNTIVQKITGEQQPPLNRFFDMRDFISWKANNYHPLNNYGYTMSLDAHVYRMSLLRPIIRDLEYNSVNNLEGKLCQFSDRISHMVSFKESLVVNIPVNNFAGMTKVGESGKISTKELNDHYLNGYRIDVEAIGKNKIVGCHQDIKLEWIND